MKKIIILLILLFNSYIVSSQSTIVTKQKYLTLLNMPDTAFISILDSIIDIEKNCSYYSEALCFSISVDKIGRYFDIDKQRHTNISNGLGIYVESCESIDILLDTFKDKYGYFYHKNHLFVVFNNFAKEVFTKTEQKKKIVYKYITNRLMIFDDSKSNWTYCYDKGNYVLMEKYICE